MTINNNKKINKIIIYINNSSRIILIKFKKEIKINKIKI